jgi:hypothetical protein
MFSWLMTSTLLLGCTCRRSLARSMAITPALQHSKHPWQQTQQTCMTSGQLWVCQVCRHARYSRSQTAEQSSTHNLEDGIRLVSCTPVSLTDVHVCAPT